MPAILISLHEPLHIAGVLTASLIIGQTLQPLMGFIADHIGGRSMLQSRHGLNTALFLVGGELGRGIWSSVASFIVVHLGLVSLCFLAIPGAITVPFLFGMVKSPFGALRFRPWLCSLVW